MVKLELLNPDNEIEVKKIQRDDIPFNFAEDVSYTIELSEWGEKNNLRGHCYVVRYAEKYIGIVLIGEAIAGKEDPPELKGKDFFRVIGFVIDKEYRGKGVGSKTLESALNEIYQEYGAVPILLECHKDNKRAIKFYEKMGFRNTGILNNQDFFLIKE